MTHNQVTYQLGRKEQELTRQRIGVDQQNANTRKMEAEAGIANKQRELDQSEAAMEYNKKMNRRQQDTAVATTVVTTVATVIIALLVLW